MKTEAASRWVPAGVIEELNDRLADLADRADKMGLDGERPGLATMTPRTIVDWRVDNDARTKLGLPVVTVDGYDVTITGGTLALGGGWALAGVVDLASHGNLVLAVPDHDLAVEYRTIGDTCEHCGRDGLGRKKLIVVEAEDGTQMAVGTTCVRDFLGHDPDKILRLLEGLRDLAAFVDDEDGWFDGGGGWRGDPTLNEVVSAAAASTIAHGYRPAAFDDATKHHVGVLIGRGKLADEAWADVTKALDGREIPDVTKAIEWAAGLTGDTDFEHNLRTLAAAGTVPPRGFGLACFIYEGWLRACGKAAERAAEAETESDSEHFGAVKARVEITADVTFTKWFDNDYGGKTLIKAVTTDGNRVAWWCSGRCPEMGDRITGKATIKDHGSFNGVDETTVTRWTWEATEKAEA